MSNSSENSNVGLEIEVGKPSDFVLISSKDIDSGNVQDKLKPILEFLKESFELRTGIDENYSDEIKLDRNEARVAVDAELRKFNIKVDPYTKIELPENISVEDLATVANILGTNRDGNFVIKGKILTITGFHGERNRILDQIKSVLGSRADLKIFEEGLQLYNMTSK